MADPALRLGHVISQAMSQSDEELWSAALRGDQTAAAAVFRRLQPVSTRQAHRVCDPSQIDIDDVVGSSFEKIWILRGRATFVSGSAIPWASSVTRFVALSLMRTERRRANTASLLPIAQPAPDHAILCDAAIDLRRSTRAVAEVIAGFTAGDRDVALYCLVKEATIREAAIALGIPEGTVKSRLRRIRRSLRAKLTDAD